LWIPADEKDRNIYKWEDLFEWKYGFIQNDELIETVNCYDLIQSFKHLGDFEKEALN